MPASFFDTNVLVYVASGDAAKADRAEAAIAAGGAISVQVLNELSNVARRKMRMSWSDTHALLNMLRGLLTVHPLTIEMHDTGLALSGRYGFERDDAMIAAAAHSRGMRHAVVGGYARRHGARGRLAHRQSVSASTGIVGLSYCAPSGKNPLMSRRRPSSATSAKLAPD